MEQVLAELRALSAKVDALAAAVKAPRAELLSPDAAAKALMVCTKTVRRLVAAGKLKTVKVGKRWKVPLAEVQRFSEPKERGPRAPRRVEQREAPEDVLANVLRRQRRTQ